MFYDNSPVACNNTIVSKDEELERLNREKETILKLQSAYKVFYEVFRVPVHGGEYPRYSTFEVMGMLSCQLKSIEEHIDKLG